ncbi:hypothetical protein ACPXCP_35440 [Streptomyces sp. DT20]|uniref:hypothetical protein n=1 Tax=Streptomyces sp. DT20 TaxID=3416519 RepID=UPI003CF826B0
MSAQLTSEGEGRRVRGGDPRRLRGKTESVLDAYGQADRPPPQTFAQQVTEAGQVLRHPHLPDLHLARD